jgi:hypothetical protein
VYVLLCGASWCAGGKLCGQQRVTHFTGAGQTHDANFGRMSQSIQSQSKAPPMTTTISTSRESQFSGVVPRVREKNAEDLSS